MIQQAGITYVVEILLQVPQVFDAIFNLFGARIDKREISETEIFGDYLSDFVVYVLRALVDECRPRYGIYGGLVFHIRRINNDGQVFVLLSDGSCQFDAGRFLTFSVSRETHIRDDTQHIVFERLVDVHGFLVRSGQKYLGSSPHAEHLLVVVQCLSHERARLGEYIFI